MDSNAARVGVGEAGKEGREIQCENILRLHKKIQPGSQAYGGDFLR